MSLESVDSDGSCNTHVTRGAANTPKVTRQVQGVWQHWHHAELSYLTAGGCYGRLRRCRTWYLRSAGPKPMANLVTCTPCTRAAAKCPASWMATIDASTPSACSTDDGPARSSPEPAPEAVIRHCKPAQAPPSAACIKPCEVLWAMATGRISATPAFGRTRGNGDSRHLPQWCNMQRTKEAADRGRDAQQRRRAPSPARQRGGSELPPLRSVCRPRDRDGLLSLPAARAGLQPNICRGTCRAGKSAQLQHDV